MVSVSAGKNDTSITLVGYGLRVGTPARLAEGITIHSSLPSFEIEAAAEGAEDFRAYAATVASGEIASFCVEISDDRGGRDLSARAWNALWSFHLLSVACGTPCLPLFSVTNSTKRYTAINRAVFVPHLRDIHDASQAELTWAAKHHGAFNDLIGLQNFSAAMRCYGNAHWIPDLDVRIMLMWAGIEGLLNVDSELSRRLALYAAILFDGTASQKAAHYSYVKKAYSLRSKAVHGGRMDHGKLLEGCDAASRILIALLARCVELKRVPTSEELDGVAVSGSLAAAYKS